MSKYKGLAWNGKQTLHKSQGWIRIYQKVKGHVETLSGWESIGKTSRMWVYLLREILANGAVKKKKSQTKDHNWGFLYILKHFIKDFIMVGEQGLGFEIEN